MDIVTCARSPGDGRNEAVGRTDRESGETFAAEPTAIGIQTLVPGVTPITPRDRLALRAAAPLESAKPQRACDLGLFDTHAINQLDMFAFSAGDS